ncbi:hypothetical protein DAI43_13095 [Achromobacter xylosoxidans]|nr:hypothetical protein DAI43_13095 [Achromobacter xylosoxidans]
MGGSGCPCRHARRNSAEDQSRHPRVLTKPSVQKSLSEQGIEAKTSTPEEFRELAAQDLKRWGQVIKQAGISAESR